MYFGAEFQISSITLVNFELGGKVEYHGEQQPYHFPPSLKKLERKHQYRTGLMKLETQKQDYKDAY